MTAVLIILGVIAVLIIWIVTIYNRLVKLKNRYLNAFSQIDVQLTRRYELIPNLVETAKAYLKHEKETLQSVIEARNTAVAAVKRAGKAPGDQDVMRALAGAEAGLGQALMNLNAVFENYPDLKADQTMMQLSEELTSTENRVAFAKQAYNDEVMTFNTQRQSFPDVLFAGMFGFSRDATLLEIPDVKAREPVKVSF